MFCSVAIICSLLANSALAVGGEDLQAEVQRLVEQLDAPRLADREAAENALLRRGPEVLPFLPKEDERAPAEVQQRTTRIRQRLERSIAAGAAESSPITLHVRSIPLSKILEQFQQQSGNAIFDYRPQFGQPVTDPKLTVDFDKSDFWPALDRVLAQAKLIVYPYAKRHAIGVVAASGVPAASGHVSYSGPFRFEPVSVIASHNFRQPNGDSLVVSVDAIWEPRLRIISLAHRMADVKAVDERGKPLPAAMSAAQIEMADVQLADAPAVKLDINLQRPPREIRQIASLQGKLRATLAGRDVTFRFAKLDGAHDVQQRIADVTVTLEQVRKSSDGWEVYIRVRFDDAGDALASHRQWIFDNAANLEGPDGKSIAYASVEPTAQEKNQIGLAYRFKTDRPLGELAFTYTTPGTIIDRAFPYELKNIDLP